MSLSQYSIYTIADDDIYVNYYKPRTTRSGRDLSTLKFSDLMHEFSQEFKESTVGSVEGLVVEKSVRNSSVLNNVKVKFEHLRNKNFSKEFNSEVVKIVPNGLRNCTKQHYLERNDWDVIIYKPGGKFIKHRDTVLSEKHFGTLLAIPPTNFKFFCEKTRRFISDEFNNDHTGGDLILYLSDGNTFTVKSSENTDKWIFVMFNPTTEHECTEILSGQRLIFKTNLVYNKTLYEFYEKRDTIQTPLPMRIINEKKEENPIDAYQLKQKLKSIIDDFNSSDYERLGQLLKFEVERHERKIHQKDDYFENAVEMIEGIEALNFSICVVILSQYYKDIEHVDNLYDKDYELYRQIKDRYPLSYLSNHQHVELEADNNDDDQNHYCYDLDEYIFDDTSDFKVITDRGGLRDLQYECDNQYPDEDIFFSQNPIVECGQIIKQGPRFNDCSYDHYSENNFTCIIVLK